MLDSAEYRDERFEKLLDFVIQHGPKMPIIRGKFRTGLFTHDCSRSELTLHVWCAHKDQKDLNWGQLSLVLKPDLGIDLWRKLEHRVIFSYEDFRTSNDDFSKLRSSLSDLLNKNNLEHPSWDEPSPVRGFQSDPIHILMLTPLKMIEDYLWEQIISLQDDESNRTRIFVMKTMYDRMTFYRLQQQTMILAPYGGGFES